MACMRCGTPGPAYCAMCQSLGCGQCRRPLTPTEVSYRTWMCDACYDAMSQKTCVLCSAILSPQEMQYGSGRCNTCYDRTKGVPCKRCKQHLTAKEKDYGTGYCNNCFDQMVKEVPAPPACIRCAGTFTAADTHPERGICNNCCSKALNTNKVRAPPTIISLHSLMYYLETGTIPSNCKVNPCIYGRLQAYPASWDASRVGAGCILPIDRPVTFVLGPDDIEQMIGKQGFDMLMTVGLTKEHVTSVVKRNQKYGLLLFEVQPGTAQ
eukprot:TRINITY_DN25265_c0_g1_i3.p1 TRINITY_DN25265_c0_g1~~TRINITY_DN25265_c0_g1_i3.p1  ORF type:complete len:278 (+),score=54.05 TRINITY_DN25265_c0_g1_i3:38-835(+)